MKEKRCHDCGCREGELHQFGCDMERCPFCGGQLITCNCMYKHFYPGFDRRLECSGLPLEVYRNGPPEDVEEQWLEVITKEGRIPYIRWPNHCEYCGKLWPKMFHVPDEEWNKYIQPGKRYEMVCRECYDQIKAMIDAGKTVD